MADDSIFGEPIFTYTRAEAISDGTLVDLMQPGFAPLVAQAGFKYPVAMTRAAFSDTVGESGDLPAGQDVNGRLWDVLWMLRLAVRSNHGGDRVKFNVMVYDGEKYNTVKLWAIVGPGDTAEPVFTIMLEGED